MTISSWVDPNLEVRVVVSDWIFTRPITNQYIVYPRSFWLVWNYLRKIGVRSVINKLRSRFTEVERNKKVYGLGYGKILSAPDGSGFFKDCNVLFFAPNHNPGWKVIGLHYAFVLSVNDFSENEGGGQMQSVLSYECPAELLDYIGWSRYSGFSLDIDLVKSVLLKLRSEYSKLLPRSLGAPPNNFVVRDHINIDSIPTGKPSAVLFGLGNYAKTTIIPNISDYLSLQRVHEIDPDQFAFFGRKKNLSLDACPEGRPGLCFDAWFIAGFHHTHTDLAISALKQSAYAVIEKPLSTTKSQYLRFMQALNETPDSRFFLCFHKRYSELHNYAKEDLEVSSGSPVDMHCVVYEIPLPSLHWYNWPNSGSRLISNGCHWLDYFMFINDYCDVEDYRKWQPRGADVVVQVKLINGAYFSMTLTDTGSQRLGVRDYIELRHRGVTITMIDSARYSAENRHRVFRKEKVNPLNAYKRMYRKISSEIVCSGKGDDLISLRSSELTLLLEER
jgi:predicted dehydrogenase